MQTRTVSLLTLLVLAGFSQALAQPLETDLKAPNEANSVAAVQTEFTCETAKEIKFNETEYVKLSRVDRVLLDARWASCQRPTDGEGADDIPVVIVNPVPTSDDDRVAYGLMKRADLAKARNLCSTAGMVGGASLTIAGIASGNPAATKIGSSLFTYSDVSCASLEKNFADGNILAALGPTTIIGHAVLNKMTKNLVNNIPLLSGADKRKVKDFLDKVTAPPSLTVGRKNVEMSAGGVKISVKKPKITAKKPRWL
jgi:hypothetical protein